MTLTLIISSITLTLAIAVISLLGIQNKYYRTIWILFLTAAILFAFEHVHSILSYAKTVEPPSPHEWLKTLQLVCLVTIAILMTLKDRLRTKVQLNLERDVASLRNRNVGFEHSIACHLAINPQGNIMDVNQSFLSKMGFHEKFEPIGLHVKHIMFDANEALGLIATLHRSDKAKGELIILGNNGARYPVEYEGGEIRDESGKVVGHHLSFVDITSRRCSECRIQEAESQFQFLADKVSAAVFVADINGLCQYANSRWCEINGTTLEKMQHSDWTRYLHPDDRVTVFKKWTDIESSHENPTLHFRIQTASGKIRHVQGSIFIRHDLRGRKIGYVGVFPDATELREMPSQEAAAIACAK